MRETHRPGVEDYRPGDRWEECDICGCDFRLSDLTRNWKGQLVCQKDYDPLPREQRNINERGRRLPIERKP